MSKLEVRLLGGFEVRHNGQPINGFESQKVRALLAYLILEPGTVHSRDRLAGLLWPEKDDDTARRNLRQAVYNLRTALPHADTSPPPIVTTHQSVQFSPKTDYWLDVAVFEERIRSGMSAGDGVDPHQLAQASELYRGDFLAGFFVADSPAFEHWLLYEQERLREMAIQALRRLIDYYLAGGEYRHGIRYARRLLEIDPLFEEAHRKLMRLYALSGRRTSALAQYDNCRSLLRTELGVEPLEETTALYHAILADDWPAKPLASQGEPVNTHIPLFGRDAAYARLRRTWEAARQGQPRLTLMEGEAGIGKTRLIEACIRDVTAQARVVVLDGRCYGMAPEAAYQPISDALRGAAVQEAHLVQQALSGLSPHYCAYLVRLVPEMQRLAPDLPSSSSLSESSVHEQLYEAVVRFLGRLARTSDRGRRVDSLILFLDDLHWADRSSLAMLHYLVRRLNGTPVWIVAAHRAGHVDPDHPLSRLQRQLSRDSRVDCIALDRLSSPDVERIAATLVGDGNAGTLARFLDRESAGLPLTITELVYLLCDEGILARGGDHQYTLAGSLPALATPTTENLHDVILARVSQLPTSARRLLTLAAVVGPQFDAELLRDAAGEHLAVVDASLDIWLKRRLVRSSVRAWSGDLPGTGSRLPSHSPARRRAYEFTHDLIRLAIYQDVNPGRRVVMHREVAAALEKRHVGHTEQVCEALAYHCMAGEMWEKALAYLEQAGDRARQALANETAVHYYEQALEVLDRLEGSISSEAQKQAWLEKRCQILTSGAETGGIHTGLDGGGVDPERLKVITRDPSDPERRSTIASPPAIRFPSGRK